MIVVSVCIYRCEYRYNSYELIIMAVTKKEIGILVVAKLTKNIKQCEAILKDLC